MLPTSTLPFTELPAPERTGGSSLNPLQDGASGTTEPFANELRLSRGPAALTGSVAVPVGDADLPETGNELPPGLAALVEELQAMQAELGPEALTEAELDVDLELTLRDLELPAGLNLFSPMEEIEVSSIDVTSLASGSLDVTAAKLADNVTFVPPAASQINDLAELTNLSVEQLEATLDRAGPRLSQDDLARVTEALRRLTAATENSTANRQVVTPASIVTVDGVSIDGRSERFRSLGIGPLGGMSGEFASASTTVRTELSNAVAELARADQAALLKPQPGGFQVHATAAAVANAAQLAPDPSGSLTTLSATINTSVRDASWGDRLNERVLMMASSKLQNAELRLTPAEMGPLRIRLSIEDNAASVSFVAQNSGTREAIESALPRLRTLLEEQGINLGQASVGEQSAEQQSAGTDERDSSDGFPGDDGEGASAADESVSVTTRVRVARGLLDTFV